MTSEDESIRLPIIKLWNVLLVPLQGDVTDSMAERLHHDVLDIIHQSDADGLILDITGVWMMDSHLCSLLSNLAASAKLMGTQTVLSGMNSDIALTLQTMGVGLETINTALTVEEGLQTLGIERSKTYALKKGSKLNRGKIDLSISRSVKGKG